MWIDVIENEEEFLKLKENWDRVYINDPDAQYFLSWTWLKGYLARFGRWFILALREKTPGSPYVAFFPLRLRTYQDETSGVFCDEVSMAGNAAADYTGIISLPDYEQRAIEGFSLFLKSQNWTDLKLDNLSGSPQRQHALIHAFRGEGLKQRNNPPKIVDNINNCICPFIRLPESWDAYLEQKLSSQNRQKLRRFLRKVEADPDYRIDFATPDTIEQDLDALFALWRKKWESRKGDRIDRMIKSSRQLLMDSFHDGNLWVPVLRYGERPLGALASLLDRQKRTILFYVTGRDGEWTTPSPGLILHGISIRRAISEGFRTYEFLRGNEPYKYMFGTEERTISCTHVRTISGHNLHDKLHPRSVRYVYEQGLELYKKGARSKAEAAFRQVYHEVPQHLGARFGLAQLLFDKGNLEEAEREFRDIAAKASEPIPVLLHLGDTLLALKRFEEAADVFTKATELGPHIGQAHYKRGVALTAAGKQGQAAKAFAALETIHSDDPDHAVYRKKARAALIRIAQTKAAKQTSLPLIHPSGFPLPSSAPAAQRPRLRKN